MKKQQNVLIVKVIKGVGLDDTLLLQEYWFCFGLGMVMAAAGEDGQKKTSSPISSREEKQETQEVEEKQESQKPKEWITVIEVSGSSDKRTDIFYLHGKKTKLIYTVKSTSPAGPLVGIYVLPEGHSLEEKGGGFPEVTVSEPGTDSTFLVKKAGNYYLDITSANATWTVKIEEEI